MVGTKFLPNTVQIESYACLTKVQISCLASVFCIRLLEMGSGIAIKLLSSTLELSFCEFIKV